MAYDVTCPSCQTPLHINDDVGEPSLICPRCLQWMHLAPDLRTVAMTPAGALVGGASMTALRGASLHRSSPK